MLYSEDHFHKSTVGTEPALHQLSPYIGKIKSSIASHLVETYSKEGQTILDPFSGAGTIPFEGWRLGRNVIANDLNRYAHVLNLAKLKPLLNHQDSVKILKAYKSEFSERLARCKIDDIPAWVRAFFHPDTLKEIITWSTLFKENENWHLLSCLLGILHHQRPGFLSYPSSHTVPYLRTKNFPKTDHPQLYQYRNVEERLDRKFSRSLRRLPQLDQSLSRDCYSVDAAQLRFPGRIDTVITSPPYMRNLHYARDNRLRLWLLGENDIESLEDKISPKQADFLSLSEVCFKNWHASLKKGGCCVLFVGDSRLTASKQTLPERLVEISNKSGLFKLHDTYETTIPESRRVRRNHTGNRSETVIVLKKKD